MFGKLLIKIKQIIRIARVVVKAVDAALDYVDSLVNESPFPFYSVFREKWAQ